MTIKTWSGAGGADWFDASNWSPAGIPADGDAVVIVSDGPRLTPDDIPPIGAHAVTLGSVSFRDPASLAAIGYSLPAGFNIAVGDTAPFAVLNFGAAYAQDGSLLANPAFDGQVDVSNGFLTINVTTTGTVAAVLQGSGTTTMGRGALVVVSGSVAASQTFAYADTNATLMLNDPADFSASITGMTSGDRIELGHLQVATSFTYDSSSATLTIFNGSGTKLGALHVSETGGQLQFFLSPFGHGGSAITTSQEDRVWGGGGGDWYDAANWTNGVPLGGDTATIGAGIVHIGSADVASHGALDFESVVLGDPTGTAPVTLQSDHATFGQSLTIVTAGTPSYSPSYVAPSATLRADGVTRVEGLIADQAQGGVLTISIGSDFELVGQSPLQAQDSGNFATVLVGQESRLEVQGGALTDNGLVLVDGVAHFAADAVVQGYGTVEIEGGGRVTVDGTVSGNDHGRPNFQFSDNLGTLTLGNVAAFDGLIQIGDAGDRIALPDVAASTLSYQADSVEGPGGVAYGTLSLIDQGGTTVAQLLVSDPNLDGVHNSDFSLSQASGGGSLITYTPQGPVTLQVSLPVAAVGNTGQVIAFSDLLKAAFGAIPQGYTSYSLSALQDVLPSESYWEQPPGGTPANSYWLLNGQTVTSDATISAAQIDDVQFVEGNSIVRTAFFTVPSGTGAGGAITEYTRYNIWTAAPAVDAPETAYSTPDPAIPGSASRFGAPDPSDIVASAYRYSTVYDEPFNTNDCNSISDEVTAGAGAIQPFINFSTDPSQNQEGGFWRIVYRGSDVASPVADWFSLVQPGDVVRMGRINETGQHTTTILGTVNPDGSIAVYDNGDHNSQGAQVIGVHDATYWTGTDPNTITIYRLDPAHQYLINGTTLSEAIQGSVFNNLIRPGGGQDSITAGAGMNEVQGTAAELNGDSIVDFHSGDSIDVTDLAAAGTVLDYQTSSGVLTVTNGLSNEFLRVMLPTGLSQGFTVTADGGGEGSLISMACFVTGTKLEGPDGKVAVEDLRVGDKLVTCTDHAAPTRRIIWIGKREVDLRRHPDADALQPIRIAPHAFGPGQPSRTVFLSPDHAVFVAGVLIPVRHLVDGHGIAIARRPRVTYWHVELERHDVILADGLEVESFLDTGQRDSFAQEGVPQRLWPDFSARIWEAEGCAPLVVAGPILAAARAARLNAAAVGSGRVCRSRLPSKVA